ncbi:MAG TPA: hypothetical protein VK741_21835 [Acetobacteraceae bacterium]|jgi:hypothetical protein|nr:hypothetical protein [Acetobacteraceae bacterium]
MPLDAAGLAAVIGNVKPDTFIAHWRSIREAKDDSHDASTTVSRAKKAAKRDGVDMDVVALMEILMKMESDERLLFLRKLMVYCQWIDSPLGAFAEGLSPPEPKGKTRDEFTVWQAGQDGLTAGRAGHTRESNPHKPGSAAHVAWDRKWASGFKTSQKKLAGHLAKNAAAMGGRAGGNGAGAPAH